MFGEMTEWIVVHVGSLGENEVLRKQESGDFLGPLNAVPDFYFLF